MRVIFGPFCGEIGWELCYWQAHGRWLKAQLPDYEFYVSTFPGRQSFYLDYADRIIFHGSKFINAIGTLDCYGGLDLKRELYFKYTEKLLTKYQAYSAIITPNHRGRFYIPREKMIFKKFGMHKVIDAHIPDYLRVTKPSVMIFPRHRDDDRDWGEEKWKKLADAIIDAGFGLVIAGIKKQSCLAYYNSEHAINLVRFGANIQQSLDITLYLMGKVFMTVGTQSFLPILSLHQGIPCFMWGAEKHRHQTELNYFSTPCRYVDDPDYEASVDEIWNNFKSFEREIDYDRRELDKGFLQTGVRETRQLATSSRVGQ